MVYRHVSFRVLFLFVCFVSFYFLGGFVSFRVLFLFFRVGSVRLAFRVFSVRFDSFIVSAAIFLLQYQYQYIYIFDPVPSIDTFFAYQIQMRSNCRKRSISTKRSESIISAQVIL